jgi:uncharacterized protein (DUF2384 family)
MTSKADKSTQKLSQEYTENILDCEQRALKSLEQVMKRDRKAQEKARKMPEIQSEKEWDRRRKGASLKEGESERGWEWRCCWKGVCVGGGHMYVSAEQKGLGLSIKLSLPVIWFH